MESPVSVALYPERAKQRLSTKARLKRLQQVRDAEKTAARATCTRYKERLARVHGSNIAAEEARWEESHETQVEEKAEGLAKRLQQLGFAHRRAGHAVQDMAYRDAELAELEKMRAREATMRTGPALERLHAAPQREFRELFKQQQEWLQATRQLESGVARGTARRFQELKDAADAAEEEEVAARQLALYKSGSFSARSAEDDPRGTPQAGLRFVDFSRTRVHATVTQYPPVALVASTYTVSGGALGTRGADGVCKGALPEVLLNAVPHNIAAKATASVALKDSVRGDEAKRWAAETSRRSQAAAAKISMERATVEAEVAIATLAEAEQQHRIASAQANVARYRSALASVNAMKEGRTKKGAMVQAEFERTFLWGGALVANLPGTTHQSAPLQTAAAHDLAADGQGAPPHQRVRVDEAFIDSPCKVVHLPTPYKSAHRSDLLESVHRNRTANTAADDKDNGKAKAAAISGVEKPADNDGQGRAKTGGTNPTALRTAFSGTRSGISMARKSTAQSDGLAEYGNSAPTPLWSVPRGAASMATDEPSATITANISTSGLLHDAQAAVQGAAAMFIAQPPAKLSIESNCKVVAPRRAAIGLREMPSWTPPLPLPPPLPSSLSSSPPSDIPYYYEMTSSLGADRTRAPAPAVGDAHDERVDPPRASVWTGCGFSPPQSSVVEAVNASAEQQQRQQQLTGSFVLPRSPMVSSSPLRLHSNMKSSYPTPASMGTQGTRSDYAESAGSGSNSTNTTPTTLGGGIVECSTDEEDGDLGSWSGNRSYRMTLDGDESMPDTLAAPRELLKRKDKGAEKLRWGCDSVSPAVVAQRLSAAAATTMEAVAGRSAGNSKIDMDNLRLEVHGGSVCKFGGANDDAFSDVHGYGDVDVYSKGSDESIEEARMREAIRARAEELALRAARAEESHILNVRQAQSRLAKQEQSQGDELRGCGYGSVIAAASVPDNGSNSTVSADTLNDDEYGNATLGGQSMEREFPTEEKDGQSLSSNEQRGKSRGVGDPHLDRFHRFDDDGESSDGSFHGGTSSTTGGFWPRGGGGNVGASAPWSSTSLEMSGGHPYTAPSGQLRRQPATRPHGDEDDGTPITTSRVDAVLNEVDVWTDGLKRLPIGDDSRPQSAMPSDHPTGRARGGYVAGSDYTADYSMGGASPSVPPEEEVEDELGAAAAAGAAASMDDAGKGEMRTMGAVHPAPGLGPLVVGNSNEGRVEGVRPSRAAAEAQGSTRGSRAWAQHATRSLARSKIAGGCDSSSDARSPIRNDRPKTSAMLKHSPYAAPVVRPFQASSPRAGRQAQPPSLNVLENIVSKKQAWRGSMYLSSDAVSGQALSGELLTVATAAGGSGALAAPSLSIDIGDSWADSGGGPATFEEMDGDTMVVAHASSGSRGEAHFSPESVDDTNRSMGSLTPIAAHSAAQRRKMQLYPPLEQGGGAHIRDVKGGGGGEDAEEDVEDGEGMGGTFDPEATIPRRVAGGGMDLADIGISPGSFSFQQGNKYLPRRGGDAYDEDELTDDSPRSPIHGSEMAGPNVQVRGVVSGADQHIAQKIRHGVSDNITNASPAALLLDADSSQKPHDRASLDDASDVVMSETMSFGTEEQGSDYAIPFASSSPRHIRVGRSEQFDSRNIVVNSATMMNSAIVDARNHAQAILNDIQMPNVRTIDDMRSSVGCVSSLGSLSLDGATDAELVAALDQAAAAEISSGNGAMNPSVHQLQGMLDIRSKPDISRRPSGALAPATRVITGEVRTFDKLASMMESHSSWISGQNVSAVPRAMSDMEELELRNTSAEHMAGDISDYWMQSVHSANKHDSVQRSSTSSSLASLVLQELEDAKGLASTDDVEKGLTGDQEGGGESVELIVADEDLEPGATAMAMGGKYVGRAGVVVSLGTTTCRLRFADSDTVTGNLKRSSVVVVDSEGGSRAAASQLFQAGPLNNDTDTRDMDASLRSEGTGGNEEQRSSSSRTKQLDSALNQAEKVAASLQERGLPYNPNLELLKKQQELLREQYAQNRELFDTLDEEEEEEEEEVVVEVDDDDEKDANVIKNTSKKNDADEMEQDTVADANESVAATCIEGDGDAFNSIWRVGQATPDQSTEGEHKFDINGLANETIGGTTAETIGRSTVGYFEDENSMLSAGNDTTANTSGAATASQSTFFFASTVNFADETYITAGDFSSVQAPVKDSLDVDEDRPMTLREQSFSEEEILQEENPHEQSRVERGACKFSVRSVTNATADLTVPRNHESQNYSIVPADDGGDEDMVVLLAPLPNDDSLSIDSAENIVAHLQRAHIVLESEDCILGSNDGDEYVSTPSLNYDAGATITTVTTTITGTTALTNKTLNIQTNVATNEQSGDRMTSSSYRESGSAYPLNLSGDDLSITGDRDELLANLALNDDSLSNSTAQYDVLPPTIHGTPRSTIHASVAELGNLSLLLNTVNRGALDALSTSEAAPQDESLASQISISLDASALGGRGSNVMEFDLGHKVDESVEMKREIFEQRSRARVDRVNKTASAAQSASEEQDSAPAEAKLQGSLPTSASPPQPAPRSWASPGSHVTSAAQRLAVEVSDSAGKSCVSVKEARVRSERVYNYLPEVAAQRTKEKAAQERLERIKKTREDDKLRRQQKQQVTPSKKQVAKLSISNGENKGGASPRTSRPRP